MKDGENETLDAQDGMILVDANLKANLGCIKRIYYGNGEPIVWRQVNGFFSHCVLKRVTHPWAEQSFSLTFETHISIFAGGNYRVEETFFLLQFWKGD